MCRIILIIPFILFILSCRKDKILPEDEIIDNYIIIGHAYGSPAAQPDALYDKLVPVLINYQDTIDQVKFIFTGDVTYASTEENWLNVLHLFDSLNIDFWVAPGNHEFYTDFFIKEVQSELFFSRVINNNLFIILNTNFKGWTIDQIQIEMVIEALSSIEDINNILVFSHQIWWANDKGAPFMLEKVFANSEELMKGLTSFWQDAFPHFQNINKPIYFFSGDIGAWQWVQNYSYQKHKNYRFYASGVGSGKDDNVLHVKVYKSGQIKIEKVNF